jgi:hypothetical protein
MLTVQGINVYYGAIHALKDLSINVKQGRDRYADRCQWRRQVYAAQDAFGAA